jgi:hypothetical protein
MVVDFQPNRVSSRIDRGDSASDEQARQDRGQTEDGTHGLLLFGKCVGFRIPGWPRPCPGKSWRFLYSQGVFLAQVLLVQSVMQTEKKLGFVLASTESML